MERPRNTEGTPLIFSTAPEVQAATVRNNIRGLEQARDELTSMLEKTELALKAMRTMLERVEMRQLRQIVGGEPGSA